MSKFIAGGCSFTLGNELSDDKDGKTPSNKSWAKLLTGDSDYVCTAFGGLGNSAIARRTFNAVSQNPDVAGVIVMWSFPSRYDWAMPRHKVLEDTRWASISPWDTNAGNEEAFRVIAGSETQQEQWRTQEGAHEGDRSETVRRSHIQACGKPVPRDLPQLEEHNLVAEHTGEEENTIHVHTGRQQPCSTMSLNTTRTKIHS
jgi:hypothetical protein